MKALQIAWKDTLTRFRDWKALAGMLAAPLVISALIGLAFGQIDTGDPTLESIPSALVNEDKGLLGQVYSDVLTSQDLDDLLDVALTDNLETATTRDANGGLVAGDVSASHVTQYVQVLGAQMANLGAVLSEELQAENFNFEQPRIALDRT